MGRRGIWPDGIDRVGRKTPGGAQQEGGRVHQQRQHRQRLAEHERIAFAPGLRQRGRPRCRRPARVGHERARGQADAPRRTGEDRASERDQLQRGEDIAIDALGSGSDYTAFLDHLQIASLDLGFGGDDGGGIYHSIYDSFYWYTNFSDGTFVHGAALSKTIGTALLRLANADILPFEFHGTADALRQYVEEIEKLAAADAATVAGDPSTSTPMRTAVTRLSKAAADYERTMARVPAAGSRLAEGSELAELNRILYSTERAFRYEAGLPRRPWFKHLGYAPGLYTGYAVKTLPGVREAVEQRQWDDANRFTGVVAAAVTTLAADVDHATSLLKKVTHRKRPQRRQRNRGGDDNVQRIHACVERNAHPRMRDLQDGVREPAPFCTGQHDQPLRGRHARRVIA